MSEKDRIKGVSKSQKKAGVKPNCGDRDNSPMDHWAFGAFDWHTQNKPCAIKAKQCNICKMELGGKMTVRSYILCLSFPKMDSLKMSSPSIIIRTNCCEFGELISSPKKVTSAQQEIICQNLYHCSQVPWKRDRQIVNSILTMAKAHGG